MNYQPLARDIKSGYDIELPDLHPGQIEAFNLRARFRAIRCGRRWGKTVFLKTVACDLAAKGASVGWFVPNYRYASEAYSENEVTLAPAIQSSSRNLGLLRTNTGGRIELWTLEDEKAGRSRHYHLVIIDEAAFTKPNATAVWEKAIRPTLLDFRGAAIVASNTNGINEDNFFWRICNLPQYGFTEYHAPSHSNPFLPADELARLEADNHPLVYAQEYLAEFVDWSGEAFFSLANLLTDGKPEPFPSRCMYVFATMDTAVKTGKENDGTGVVYWAYEQLGEEKWLKIIDYEYLQIEGSVLEYWLPAVYRNLEEYSVSCKARLGSRGCFVEDKASGSILLQQARRRNYQVHEMPQKLTQLGKAERALNVSGYVYRGKVKLLETAFNRIISFKQVTKNHLLGQVMGFRVGDVEDRHDDLLDAFTYGIAISLGNWEGW
jgi:phage terminase large subunit-like protein